MKKIFPLIIILFLTSCFPQKRISRKANTEYLFSEIVKQFDSKKINYIGLEKKCIGGVLKEPTKNDCEKCYSKNNIYIFWTENNKSYVKKYDNCSHFNTIEIGDFKPKEFLKKNTQKLQNEKVGKFELEKGKYLFLSHSCFRKFIINDGKLKYENEYDINNLTGENDNINYIKNNSLKIIKLEENLSEIIDRLEYENKFKRNKKTCYNNVYN